MIRCSSPKEAYDIIASKGLIVSQDDQLLKIKVPDGDIQTAELVSAICQKDISIYEVHKLNAGLSDIVLKVLNDDNGEKR